MRVVLLMVLLLPACGLGQGCTEVGAEPLVRLEGAEPPGEQVRVCLGTACEQARWREDELLLPVPLPEEGEVDLRVSLVGPSGTVVEEDVVRVEVEAFTPNGPACPPRVGTAALRREGEGWVQVPTEG